MGTSTTAENNVHAFITGPNGIGITDVGVLGANSSTGEAINDAGQVAGFSYMPDGNIHAFITGLDGLGMTDLGTLPDGIGSHATAINDAGQVVGWTTMNGEDRAFITGPNGVGMTDLNSLVSLPGGLTLVAASGINNLGQVVALATVITVIPEPETYALMLAGLGLIGFIRRKKSEDLV